MTKITEQTKVPSAKDFRTGQTVREPTYGIGVVVTPFDTTVLVRFGRSKLAVHMHPASLEVVPRKTLGPMA